MSKKSLRRERARLRELKKSGLLKEAAVEANAEETAKAHAKKTGKKTRFLEKIKKVYEKDYKKLLWITIILLLLSFCQIGYQLATTGDFLNKGVSLKGGITVTVPGIRSDAQALEDQLKEKFMDYDIGVRKLTSAGTQSGIVVDADITDKDGIDSFMDFLREKLSIEKGDYSVETIGSSLGASFFKETIIAVLIAFVFMGIVVFLYFRIPVPSMAVILAAMSDIIITLAVVNILGMKISTAGIAAFLMLIGYSVDTDILLSTRVLKRKEGTVLDGVYSAMKTGLTMSITTLTAVIVALIFSQSEVLKQIMIIIFIGLIVDLLSTWIQNAGILRWYLEKKPEKAEIKA